MVTGSPTPGAIVTVAPPSGVVSTVTGPAVTPLSGIGKVGVGGNVGAAGDGSGLVAAGGFAVVGGADGGIEP